MVGSTATTDTAGLRVMQKLESTVKLSFLGVPPDNSHKRINEKKKKCLVTYFFLIVITIRFCEINP